MSSSAWQALLISFLFLVGIVFLLLFLFSYGLVINERRNHPPGPPKHRVRVALWSFASASALSLGAAFLLLAAAL